VEQLVSKLDLGEADEKTETPAEPPAAPTEAADEGADAPNPDIHGDLGEDGDAPVSKDATATEAIAKQVEAQ
jgi:hypothetical protein